MALVGLVFGFRLWFFLT